MSGSARTSSPRAGSIMSSKQMARAAVNGNRITVLFLSSDTSVSGYVVGMDDFHWMLAVPQQNEVETVLIHKGGPDLVRIDRVHLLSHESHWVADEVHRIGGPFFDFCERAFLGKQQ